MLIEVRPQHTPCMLEAPTSELSPTSRSGMSNTETFSALGDSPAESSAELWEITASPVARATSVMRHAGGHIRVAVGEAAGGPEWTATLLNAAVEVDVAAAGRLADLPELLAGRGPADGVGPSWSTAATVLDLGPAGRARVACFQSPPVLVISAARVTWISPRLLGLQGVADDCLLEPGDRLLALTPSCVACLDPRLLRTLTRQAPRTRSADDLADLLITRAFAEDLRGWRRECAFGFVIVTRSGH
jgi:hypothetical protein